MKVRIIIPARLDSSRFPKKLIKMINGKTLIEHVCLRAKKLKPDSLVVATDSVVIKEIVENNKIEVWYSKRKYNSGTERIAGLVKDYKFNKKDIIINIQGDEYNFSITGAKKLINYLRTSKTDDLATLIFRNINQKSYQNKNTVKVIIDKNNYAQYFSRSIIPFGLTPHTLCHIGIYAYRCSILHIYTKLKKCPEESIEKLEQLRFLWNCIPIKCIKININNSVSINSPIDLKLARKK